LLSQQPPPQRPGDLRPDRATSDQPPSHGQGTSPSHAPGSPDEEVTIVVRQEPNGPTTTLSVLRRTSIGELRRLAIAKFKVAPGDAAKYLVAKSGWVVEANRTVGEMLQHELDFFSLGLKDDVYLCDEQLRMLK
jgi:hypothetical protein